MKEQQHGEDGEIIDTMIEVDLAKAVCQLHGASMTGQLKYSMKVARSRFRQFMADQTPLVVAMEACGSAHYWARELIKLGHEVKLIAPQYVLPFVKGKKNYAPDAEAIVITAQRPEMQFAAPKSEEQQADGHLGKTCMFSPGTRLRRIAPTVVRRKPCLHMLCVS